MNNGRRWQITAVVTLGLFMAILDNSIVSVALPQMEDAFHTTYENITWVATAYFLAQAAVIPIVGYLCDRIGTKIVFLVALILFTLGSACCALSPTNEILIASRIFQGIGGGALLPVAFAIIYRIFPPTDRGKLTAVIGIPVIMAPAFGPTIGGYLSTTFDWSAIFTVNLPIGIIALILGFLTLPGFKAEQAQNNIEEAIEESLLGDAIIIEKSSRKKRFDIAGLILSMVGFSVLSYGISEAATDGWGSGTVLAYIAVGAVVLVGFIIVELIVSDPVMDLRLFKNYTFTISNILMWVVTAVLFGGLFLLPLFFENVQGDSALTAGEILISQGLATGVGMALSGILYNRVGPRILAVVGLLFVIAGTYGLTQLNVGTTGQELQLWLIFRGLGLGCLNTPLQTLALSVISNKAMAKASSLVSVMRQVSGAIGVAILTTYLTQQTTNHATAIGNAIQAGLTTNQFTATALTCVQAAGPTLNQTLVRNCISQYALTNGLTDTFLAILIACSVCIVLALIIGRDPAIEAYKEARARGEDVKLERQAVMSE
jgi:MFS family permease